MSSRSFRSKSATCELNYQLSVLLLDFLSKTHCLPSLLLTSLTSYCITYSITSSTTCLLLMSASEICAMLQSCIDVFGFIFVDLSLS